MARTEGRLRTSIWDDQDFLALSMDAKGEYSMLLSQPGVNHAGVLTIPRREWVNLFPADEDAAERLARARHELEARRFIVVDEGTDELLIRAFLRWETEPAPPGTFCSGMEAARGIRSSRLREVAYGELMRMDAESIEAKRPGRRQQLPIDAYRSTVAALRPGPPDPTGLDSQPSDQQASSREHEQDTPCATADTSDVTCMETHAMSQAPVAVAVDVAVEPTVVEDLGGRAGAREAAPRESPKWPEQPCGSSHDPRPNCGGCAAARRASLNAVAAERAGQERVRDASRVARERCPWVELHDPTGWLEDPETRDKIVRCDHQTEPRFQIARARDVA